MKILVTEDYLGFNSGNYSVCFCEDQVIDSKQFPKIFPNIDNNDTFTEIRLAMYKLI